MHSHTSDYHAVTTVAGGRTKINKSRQDKGHAEEVRRFIDAVAGGGEAPIAFDAIDHSMRVTFKLLESLRERKEVQL